jgi:CheY-like chemotaxis protein
LQLEPELLDLVPKLPVRLRQLLEAHRHPAGATQGQKCEQHASACQDHEKDGRRGHRPRTGRIRHSILAVCRMSDRRKTLLIVDDDEGMRETMTAMLRQDYRVLRVATGEAALQVMQKEDVELVLLDVHLPGISGIEVLRILKENYPYIEIIVVSGAKEVEVAIEVMRHGAYHYISKEFDADGLRSLVAKASERQELNR